MVHVESVGGRPHGPSSVVGHVHRGGGPVDPFRVGGVHPYLGIVKGPDVVAVPVVPGPASVVGAVEPALPGAVRGVLRLHQGVQDIRVAQGDGEADSPQEPLGPSSALHLRPGVPPVGGLPEGAPRPSALEEVRSSYPFPGGGEEDVRITGVDGHLHESRLVADELHQLPGLAAVVRAVKAPLGIGGPGLPHGRRPHPVGVGGVDYDSADDLGFHQAPQLPGQPAVGGLVDPAPGGDGVPGRLLAGAGPDLEGVGGSDGDVPHGDHPLVREQGPEGGPVVGGLPDAPGRRRHVEGLGRARDALHVGDPPGEVGWPDGAPAELGEGGRVQGRGQLPEESGLRREGEDRQGEEEGRPSHHASLGRLWQWTVPDICVHHRQGRRVRC